MFGLFQTYPFSLEDSASWVFFVGKEFFVEARFFLVSDASQVRDRDQLHAQTVHRVTQQLTMEVNSVERAARY